MSRKKVLLINRGGSDNLGDQAIKISLENLLKDIGYETDFSDFANIYSDVHYNNKNVEKGDSSSIATNLKAMVPIKVRWFLKNHTIFSPCFNKENYYAAIIGGGQLFNNNKIFALAMFLWVYLLRLKKNPKIILFGIGAMQDLSLCDKFLYKMALRKIDEVYVRDEHSQKVLFELFGCKAKITYDVAFCFNIFDPYSLEKIKDEGIKKNKILVGVSHYSRYLKYNNDKSSEEYYNYWVNYIADLYISNNNEIKLFYTTEEDLRVVNMIQDRLKKEKNIFVLISDVNNLGDLINEINNSDTVISPRMHALILAKIYQCNVQPVHISRKIKSYSEHYLKDNFDLEKIQDKVIEDLENALNKITSINV